MTIGVTLKPALEGNTVLFTATAQDYNGNLIDLTTPTFSVYTEDGVILAGMPLTAVRDSLGQYHVEWTVPSNQAPAWYAVEMKGFTSSLPHLERARFQIAFA